MCVTIIITYCASMLEYWMSVLSLNQSLCMCTVTESITVHVYCHWINHCTCILSLNQSLCMCTVTDSITVHVYCHWLYHCACVLSLTLSLCMYTVTDSITVHVYCHWLYHCACVRSHCAIQPCILALLLCDYKLTIYILLCINARTLHITLDYTLLVP